MRFSKYFLKTSKTVSETDKCVSAKLLKQAGFIRESSAGRFYFLPIGQKVQQKIMAIIKEELDAVGCQEMLSPVLHPLELWQETNRTNTTGFELMKVKDRRGAEFALGGTAEEMFVDLIRQYKLSYRDLPLNLYQFSTKFRDELRARGGLLRVREFVMKDGYSFHRGEEDFQLEYEKIKNVYINIFNKLGLEVEVIESDNGYIGGEYCHEFVVESDIGESKYFVSGDGSYAAHEDVAVFEKENKNIKEETKELKKVVAARGNTMEDGARLHHLPVWQQIKDVLFVDNSDRFVLAVIRGDLNVNETKLKNILKVNTLRHATDEEIRQEINSEPGFISPVNLKNGLAKDVNLVIVGDNSLRTVVNAYGGSNKKHQDLLNVNIDRDYVLDIEGDIALAQAGYKSKGGVLIEKRGIEVGNIFQLGYYYSQKMKGAVYVDTDGKEKPFYMGCYGIGIGRTIAAVVEKYHDQKGIIWPENIAPFYVHLVVLDNVNKEADNLYQEMVSKGIEVLYDDRDKSAGEKFADADMIGLPLRIIISKKTLAKKSVEIKKRASADSQLVAINSVVDLLLKKEI